MYFWSDEVIRSIREPMGIDEDFITDIVQRIEVDNVSERMK